MSKTHSVKRVVRFFVASGIRIFSIAILLALQTAFTIGTEAAAETKLRDVSIEGSGSRGTISGIRQIVVVGTDGHYRSVESAVLNFDVRLKARITNVGRNYRIWSATVRANIPHTGPGKLVHAWERSYLDTKDGLPRKIDRKVTFNWPIERLGRAENRAIRLCNQRLAATGHATNGFEGRMPVFLSFVVKAGRQYRLIEFDTSGGDYNIKPDTARVRKSILDANITVICKPIPNSKKVSDRRTIEIVSVKLVKLSVGRKCPQTWELQARFRANRGGKFFISRRSPIASSTLIPLVLNRTEGKAGLLPNTQFQAIYRHKMTLDQIGDVARELKLKVVLENGKSSDWVTAKVRCAPLKVTSMWLDYQTSTKSTCPKRVTERVRIFTNRPGPVPFEIKHQGGLVLYRGTADAKLEGNQYVAVAQRNFQSSQFDADLLAKHRDSSTNSGWTRLKVDCLQVTAADLKIQRVGNQCPTKAFVTATYTASGKGRFKQSIRCSGGRQLVGTAQAKKTGSKFVAQETLVVNIEKSETLKCIARAEEFATKATYAAQHVFQCGDPSGSDDVSVGPKEPVDPGRRNFKGSFQYVDKSRNKRCPRKVSAVINFYATHDANVHWSLDCKHGSHSGVAKVNRNARGERIAPALVRFNLPKGTDGFARVRCALKTVSPGKRKLHWVLGRNFQCINRDAGSPSDGLTATGDPAENSEEQIVCRGGTLRGKKCVCRRDFKRKRLGRKRFACIRRIVEPIRVSCRGGTVRSGKCVCGPNKKRQVLSPTSVVCKSKPRKISCRGGTVRSGKCICGRNKKRQAISRTAFVCKTQPRKISCRGGTVRGGKCVCGRNTKRQRLGPRAFLCRKKPRSVRCIGGKVRGGRCKCPRKRPVFVRGRCVRPAG